jgi:myo-inositol-1(or 4)-monophosphatase
VDGFWEQRLNRWDCLGGILLVEEAGGKVTDYRGGSEGLRQQRVSLIASNGHLHPAILEVIQAARNGMDVF